MNDAYHDPYEAAQALREGRIELIVGAIPFNTATSAALMVPQHVTWAEGPLEPPAYFRGPSATAALRPQQVTEITPVEQHSILVEAAIATIMKTQLEKVVLARAVDVEFQEAPDPLLLAARFLDLSANRDGFAVDLTCTGEPQYAGAMLVGSSPEVLVRKHGREVTAYPLAGSIGKGNDHVENEIRRAELEASQKDQFEHHLVVDHYRNVLEPLCSTLHIPDVPEITETNEMFHLGTPIHGVLKESELAAGVSALDLALMLHPTPAVGGTPTADALAIIEEAEPDREFYAGAVGWCDTQGDGEFMVTIRCAQVQGERARLWAGGGIVETSIPEQETAETSAKLATAFRALNVRLNVNE